MYIRNFCSAGYFVGAYASLIQSAPSDMTIEAMENSLTLETDFTVLQSFLRKGASWQEFGRQLAERWRMVLQTEEKCDF